MTARITFIGEVYVEGETLSDVKKNFEQLQLFDWDAFKENDARFVDLVRIEDADTCKELEEE